MKRGNDMKKAAIIMLIAAAFAEIFFCILFIPSGVFLAITGGNDIGMQDIISAGVIVFVKHLFPVVVKLVAVLILLAGLRSNTGRIWPDILMLVLFSGLMSIGNIFINYAFLNVVSSMGGSDLMAGYSLVGTGVVLVGFLHAVSNSLLIMGACFGIAYKKLLLPIGPED